MKTVVTEFTASTLYNFLYELEKLNGFGMEGTCVTINAHAIHGRLIEEILTDGSKVYDVELSEDYDQIPEVRL